MAAWSISQEDETFDQIHVQIKVGGILSDDAGVISGKALEYDGCKIPVTRLGTWIFHKTEDQADVSTLLRSGGAIVAVMWAFYRAYPKCPAWISDVEQQTFFLEVLKSKKKGVLNEIYNGQMKRKLDKELKSISSVDSCKNAKVKLIQILAKTEVKKSTLGGARESLPGAAELARLEDSEKTAALIHQKEYSLAYLKLKKDLQSETDTVLRFQMLLRLTLCTVEMGNTDEADSACYQLLSMLKTMDISPDDVPHYDEEFSELERALVMRGPYVRTVEIILASAELTKRLKDPEIRIDRLCAAVARATKAVWLILSLKPTLELYRKAEKYLEQIDTDLVGFIKNEKNASSLHKAQCIYYCEFALQDVRAMLGREKPLFRESAKVFKDTVGHWNDMPLVMNRLLSHPIARHYFAEEDFVEIVKEICENPKILSKKLDDPRIAHADRILKSEFGFGLASAGDNSDRSTDENSELGAFGDFFSKSSTQSTSGQSANQRKSEEEKKKGNAAYKNKDFKKALQHYDKAIVLDPGNAVLYSNKAACFLEMVPKNLNLAREACIGGLAILRSSGRESDPATAKLLARLGKVEHLAGDYQNAVKLFEASLQVNFDPKVLRQLNEAQSLIFRGMVGMPNVLRFPFPNPNPFI